MRIIKLVSTMLFLSALSAYCADQKSASAAAAAGAGAQAMTTTGASAGSQRERKAIRSLLPLHMPREIRIENDHYEADLRSLAHCLKDLHPEKPSQDNFRSFCAVYEAVKNTHYGTWFLDACTGHFNARFLSQIAQGDRTRYEQKHKKILACDGTTCLRLIKANPAFLLLPMGCPVCNTMHSFGYAPAGKPACIETLVAHHAHKRARQNFQDYNKQMEAIHQTMVDYECDTCKDILYYDAHDATKVTLVERPEFLNYGREAQVAENCIMRIVPQEQQIALMTEWAFLKLHLQRLRKQKFVKKIGDQSYLVNYDELQAGFQTRTTFDIYSHNTRFSDECDPVLPKLEEFVRGSDRAVIAGTATTSNVVTKAKDVRCKECVVGDGAYKYEFKAMLARVLEQHRDFSGKDLQEENVTEQDVRMLSAVEGVIYAYGDEKSRCAVFEAVLSSCTAVEVLKTSSIKPIFSNKKCDGKSCLLLLDECESFKVLPMGCARCNKVHAFGFVGPDGKRCIDVLVAEKNIAHNEKTLCADVEKTLLLRQQNDTNTLTRYPIDHNTMLKVIPDRDRLCSPHRFDYSRYEDRKAWEYETEALPIEEIEVLSRIAQKCFGKVPDAHNDAPAAAAGAGHGKKHGAQVRFRFPNEVIPIERSTERLGKQQNHIAQVYAAKRDLLGKYPLAQERMQKINEERGRFVAQNAKKDQPKDYAPVLALPKNHTTTSLNRDYYTTALSDSNGIHDCTIA